MCTSHSVSNGKAEISLESMAEAVFGPLATRLNGGDRCG